MKPASLLLILATLGLLSLPGVLSANSLYEVSHTNENTLNDLVRRVPILSYFKEEELGKLSAIQEQLLVHERKMRGDGLPEPLATAFSINYSAIHHALVEDRISEEYGRDLLSVHRQLLDRTYLWMKKRVRDESFPDEVVRNLHFFVSELKENAAPVYEIPAEVRTPVINGYQVWLGELLAWACDCNGLSAGAIGRIEVFADELERFEGYYKKDGVLKRYEREQLHQRFLKLTRETIETLGRLY